MLRFFRRSALEGRAVACPLCGGLDHRVIGRRDRHFAPLRNVGCEDCGLVFSNPMPTDAALAAYYERSYRQDYQGATAPRGVHLLRGEQRAAIRLREVQAHLPRGASVLDLGAGAGEFVAALSEAGFVARGVEPSADFSRFARSHYGVDVAQGYWQDLGPQAGCFDAVTMHHVLEHLSEPVAALIRLRSVLKTGGLLIVAVPNVADRRRSPQSRWHVAHVLSFTPETLDALAARVGFAPVGGEGTVRVYRKVDLPQDWRPDLAVAQRVLDGLATHRMLRHYLGLTPYARLVRRSRRHAAERYAALPVAKRSRLRRAGALLGAALAIGGGFAAFELS